MDGFCFKEGTLFRKILSILGVSWATAHKVSKSRRKYVRHQAFNSEVIINGKNHTVQDWSLGGVAFDVSNGIDVRIGDKIQVIIKFKFVSNDITISQDAHIVRVEKGSCAAEFEPLPQPVRDEFDRVLETLYTQSFIESQTAL